MESGIVSWILVAFGFFSGSEILPNTHLSNGSSGTHSATTFRACDKTPEETRFYSNTPIKERLEGRSFYQNNNCTEILQMTNFPPKVYLSNNGLINTVMDAYNGHHKLVIRPDDVWAAIMTQFSFYVNKNAEELRGKFVNFEGKKNLTVTVPGSLRNAPYDVLVALMTQEIHKNLDDPQVKNWILPKFSTTTENDLITIGVIFMATMKKYFDYGFGLACGIPEITLEGTVEDWKNIHKRLKKLKKYNLKSWYDMLEPVLREFVNAKQGNVNEDFWQKIAHHEAGGSGPSYISGWITVFAVFDQDGNWRKTKLTRGMGFGPTHDLPELTEIETKWLRIDTDDIPPGVVEVDVKIDDNGQKYNSVMFAGHVGTEIKPDRYTVQPTLGWAIALKT